MEASENSPERRLFQAVVAVAVEDAVYTGRERARIDERDESRAWLLGNSENFRNVCSWAGYDPDDVRENAKKLSDRGWQPAPTVEPKKIPPLKTSRGKDVMG